MNERLFEIDKTALPLVRIVDDDAQMRSSLAFMLRQEGYECAAYESARAFLTGDAPSRPGCLLLDVRMPDMTGLEVQSELEKRGVKLPVLFLSAHGNIAMAVHAVRHGAVDFLEKPVDPMVFLQKVSRAVTAAMTDAAAEAKASDVRERFASLTPREREVVEAVLDNHPNKVIARNLGLEVSTDKMHRANAFAKLGVHSPAELIRLAYESGFSAPGSAE